MILKVISEEENKFNKTIDQGLTILEDFEAAMKEEGKTTLDGADAFKLYDTYGFPLDLTKEILEEKGFDVVKKASRRTWKHRDRLQERLVRQQTTWAADVTVYQSIDPSVTSKFVGYDKLVSDSKILAFNNRG